MEGKENIREKERMEKRMSWSGYKISYVNDEGKEREWNKGKEKEKEKWIRRKRKEDIKDKEVMRKKISRSYCIVSKRENQENKDFKEK